MFALQTRSLGKKVEVHALPCKLHHNGAVDAQRFQPTKETDSSQTAYFRGRKLRGRTVEIPVSYEGCVLKKTDSKLAQTTLSPNVPQGDADMEDDEVDEVVVPVQNMDKTNTFHEITVWGHGNLPHLDNDPYARGLQEWIAFAEAVHGSPAEKRAS